MTKVVGMVIVHTLPLDVMRKVRLEANLSLFKALVGSGMSEVNKTSRISTRVAKD